MRVKRVLTRLYVSDLVTALPFYEELLGEVADLRFSYEAVGLELAVVGNLLLLAGSEAALAPFRETRATLVVESLASVQSFLAQYEVKVIRAVRQVPTGQNLTVQHPDGSVIEYVEFRTD